MRQTRRHRPIIGDYTLFEELTRLPPDAILGLMARFKSDVDVRKVDLGVGVYRDEHGDTPILESVRRAEQQVLAGQKTKSYVGPAGREEFNRCVETLVLGPSHDAVREGRTRTIQAPGGCGALRVGAELLRVARASATVYVSDPTWANHLPLLGHSGLRLERYPYYDASAHQLHFDAMLDRLAQAAPGDVVLLHACCHNPTGADLSASQWDELIELLLTRRLVPFLDLAYQGFGDGLDEDAGALRRVAERVPEALVATSFSKNLGLYRERVGALTVIAASAAQADAASSHVLQIARGIYSMPPDHGAAIAARLLGDAALRESWVDELRAMRRRVTAMRRALADALRAASGTADFDFLATQRGMFSLLGAAPRAVERLRDRHHIYMTPDSRINLAGIMPHNAAYVASAVLEAGRATRDRT